MVRTHICVLSMIRYIKTLSRFIFRCCKNAECYFPKHFCMWIGRGYVHVLSRIHLLRFVWGYFYWWGFFCASLHMMDGSHHYWKERGCNTIALGVERFVTLFRYFRNFFHREKTSSLRNDLKRLPPFPLNLFWNRPERFGNLRNDTFPFPDLVLRKCNANTGSKGLLLWTIFMTQHIRSCITQKCFIAKDYQVYIKFISKTY